MNPGLQSLALLACAAFPVMIVGMIMTLVQGVKRETKDEQKLIKTITIKDLEPIL